MRRLLQIVFVGSSLACAGCAHHGQAPADARPPSTVPSTTAPANAAVSTHRLTPSRRALLLLQEEYLAKEGAAHRGGRFEKLAGAMYSADEQQPLTEFEILSLLGPPDYGDSDGRGALFIYVYDRFAPKDWYVRIDVSPGGTLQRIGWNATSEINLGLYKPFKLGAARPTTPEL